MMKKFLSLTVFCFIFVAYSGCDTVANKENEKSISQAYAKEMATRMANDQDFHKLYKYIVEHDVKIDVNNPMELAKYYFKDQEFLKLSQSLNQKYQGLYQAIDQGYASEFKRAMNESVELARIDEIALSKKANKFMEEDYCSDKYANCKDQATAVWVIENSVCAGIALTAWSGAGALAALACVNMAGAHMVTMMDGCGIDYRKCKNG